MYAHSVVALRGTVPLRTATASHVPHALRVLRRGVPCATMNPDAAEASPATVAAARVDGAMVQYERTARAAMEIARVAAMAANLSQQHVRSLTSIAKRAAAVGDNAAARAAATEARALADVAQAKSDEAARVVQDAQRVAQEMLVSMFRERGAQECAAQANARAVAREMLLHARGGDMDTAALRRTITEILQGEFDSETVECVVRSVAGAAATIRIEQRKGEE